MIKEISYPDKNDMTRRKASKKDKSFYADLDDGSVWGVYGDVSGFCYATPPGGKEGAEKLAKEMNKAREEESNSGGIFDNDNYNGTLNTTAKVQRAIDRLRD